MALRGLLEDDAGLTFFAPLRGSGAGSGLLYSTASFICHICRAYMHFLLDARILWFIIMSMSKAFFA